jgi:class 3 adenylate cyclase
VVELAEALLALGIRPWLDLWDIVPGRPWQDGLNEAIQAVNAAVVCVGPSGFGSWQDPTVMALIRQFVNRKSPVIPVLLPGAIKEIALPALLTSFPWVDLRQFTRTNTRPLAQLVAWLLGKHPRALAPDQLAERVASILAAPWGRQDLPSYGEEIVLPVNLPSLTKTEVEAIRQQTARLLGIPSLRLKSRGTRLGSVKVVIEVEDLDAVSQLFAKVHRCDAEIREFFRRCQIDLEEFSRDNGAAVQRVTTAVQARQAAQDDPDTQVSIISVPDEELKKWTGGAKVLTVAVVFTDIVDSTKLCVDLSDAVWDGIRQQHFKRAVTRIRELDGILIKNTGDGILALFHDATAAVEFAVILHDETGHATVRIRAGVHVGQVGIFDSDTFGRHVNFAARVMGFAQANGVMTSNRIRQDVAQRGEAETKNLAWTEFPNVALKGFPEPETLWGVRTIA